MNLSDFSSSGVTQTCVNLFELKRGNMQIGVEWSNQMLRNENCTIRLIGWVEGGEKLSEDDLFGIDQMSINL